MALRVYNVEMSDASIDKCIENLRKYQKQLDEKMKKFMDALADIGIDVIKSTVASIPPDEIGEYSANKTRLIFPSGGHYGEMSIYLQSEQVLFVEFSAGITYGTNTYPLPSGSGYGMGTYNPSSRNWSNPDGWYYKDASSPKANDKGLVHTYGNRAYMPMYHSLEAMSIAVWHTAMKTIGA